MQLFIAANLDHAFRTRLFEVTTEVPGMASVSGESGAPKRALITGITGQDGIYLSELLLSKGYEVYGLLRGQNNPKAAMLEEVLPSVRVIAGDLYPMRIGEGESAHVVSLYGTGAAFLLVVDRSVPLAGYTLSVIHLASEPAPGQHDFKYKIQVSTRAGIICLSGKTQSVGCLRSPYQPCASMFVEEDIWDPEYSPVYIELR
jgi:hypothetical protein